jgi:glycosyltransferase involved in cell wall biosynthesis
MLSLLRGLSGQHQFYVAAPEGQAYSPKFAEHAEMVGVPFRRFSLFAFLHMVRIVRNENVNFIHSHGKGGGIYGRLLGWLTGRPVVHTFHGFHYRHLPPLKRFVYLALERWLAKRTAVLLNVSVSEQAACAEVGVLRGAQSVVVPNGVVVPAAFPGARPPKGERGWVLVNVARHESEKGVDGVVEIARKLSERGINYELWLVGEGEQTAALRKQVAASGLESRVRFLGFRDNVAALLSSADIFISASHGEGMPLTILEAMAAGLPSVASDVIGNRDVVEHGETGFLFPLNNPAGAADAIAQLIGDVQLYNRCSETAHARAVERYSVEVMCERINAVYEEVAANTLMGRN